MPHPEARRRKQLMIDNTQKLGPGVVPAPDPKKGGPTMAPAIRKSPVGDDGPYGRVAYGVLNMRLTEDQFADLRVLRDRTGITIQAHIRRAVLDYIHAVRKEQPELLVPLPSNPDRVAPATGPTGAF